MDRNERQPAVVGPLLSGLGVALGCFLVILLIGLSRAPPYASTLQRRVYRRNIDPGRIQGVDQFFRFACRQGALRKLMELRNIPAIVVRRAPDEWLLLVGATLTIVPLSPNVMGSVPAEFTLRSKPLMIDVDTVEGMTTAANNNHPPKNGNGVHYEEVHHQSGAIARAAMDPSATIRSYATLDEAMRHARPRGDTQKSGSTDYVVGGSRFNPLFYVVSVRNGAALSAGGGPSDSRVWVRLS